ncbi:MAG TPA: DUF4231 domain-containing protein [Candidatus Limnocylindrales bacterium]|nr:DUF4231 domain-containing protein [Candidatus Limnocylindrales bacterium]
MRRIDGQIDWYDRSARLNQYAYKGLKTLSIVSAALIPILAALKFDAAAASVLGGVIVISEGIQQLNQHHETWISHRLTAESLKRERALFVGDGSPYIASENPLSTLSERTEEIVARETSTWNDLQRDTTPDGTKKVVQATR